MEGLERIDVSAILSGDTTGTVEGDLRASGAAGVVDTDALDGIVERARLDVMAPFATAALRAAADLEDHEPLAFDEIARALRSVDGFRYGPWRAAVKVARRTLRTERAAAARAEADAAARRRAEARAAEQVERTAARAAAARAATDTAAHHGEADVDEITYASEPGRTWMESEVGGDRPRTRRDTLCEFSARLVELVLDVDGPGAPPRPALYVLDVVCAATPSRVQRIEVSAEDWGACAWHERHILRPGLGPYGRQTREHVRRAIEALSGRPTIRHRFRYVGWAAHEGRPVYLHGGGAIDASGIVEGLRAEPPVQRVSRFSLPDPSEFETERDLGAVMALLGTSPASVVAPLVGLAFRAAMGGARHAAHVTGRSGLGKSVLLGCVAQLFGPTFSAREPLLSWRARGVTVQGIMETLACARDVVVQVDDLQRNPESQARAIAVFPAHFEGASQVKGRARGGSLSLIGPQSVLGSSGETLPDEPSVRNRVLLLDLDERPTPRLDGAGGVKARGDRGDLARCMARFVQWWAARVDEHRPRLATLEREAVERWGLGAEGRAAEVVGGAAVGLNALFAFAREHGLPEADVRAARDRARAALRVATLAHIGHVADESGWRRYLDLVAQGLGSGRAHVLHGRRSGPTFACGEPEQPAAWGWSPRTSTTVADDGPRRSTSWQPGGPCVGWTRDDRPGRVLLAPGPSLRAALDLARAEGRPLPIDVTALGRELMAEGIIERAQGGRGVGRVRWSWGSTDVEGWEVPAKALGIGSEGGA